LHKQKRSLSACSSYSSDDDGEAEVVSAQTQADVISGADEQPFMSAEDVISEIESMMEVCRRTMSALFLFLSEITRDAAVYSYAFLCSVVCPSVTFVRLVLTV